MLICETCVMDETVPGFEVRGERCSFCSRAIERLSVSKRDFMGNSGSLDILVQKIKASGSGRDFDCVIGVSGGVDSSFVAHKVVELGLRPVAVHLDNGWNSELAVANINKILNKLRIPLETHVVDWEEFRSIQLAFIRSSVANLEMPTDHGILALLFKTARKYKIKYIIHGGNLSSESIMPSGWMEDARDLAMLRSVVSAYGGGAIRSLPTMSYPMLATNLVFFGLRYVGLLNYLDYKKDEAISILESEYGWRKYSGKHFESFFTRFFQSFILPVKYGIDKRKAHYSSLIVANQLDRAAALNALQQLPYDESTILQDISYFLQKFQLSDEDFEYIMNQPRGDLSRFRSHARLLKRFSQLERFGRFIAAKV